MDVSAHDLMPPQKNEKSFLKFDIPKDSTYYLRAACTQQMLPFIRVWRDDLTSTPTFVPAASKIEFLITPRNRASTLFFLRDEVDAKAFRRRSLQDIIKLLKLRRFHRYTKFDDGQLVILPLLYRSGQDGIELARTMRTLAQWGVGVSTPDLQSTLSYEFTEHPVSAPAPLPVPSPIVGIVIHLHYADLWPDFEKRLRQISLPFKLIVTLSTTDAALYNAVHVFRGDAKVLVYQNRGRDVGPFIQLLHDGHLDEVDLVCKLHGKKTVSLGSRWVFGEVWRRSMLNALVGSDQVVRNIIAQFLEQPNLGLIGPSRFRLPSEFRNSYKDTWDGNEELTRRLAAQLGGSDGRFDLDFFAGTMFWIRRELLDLLKILDLSQDDFPDEAGQSDGTLQHALERLFGALPNLAQPTMFTQGVTWPPKNLSE